MRAIVQDAYGGAEVLRVGEVARPEPGEKQVLIEVRAAGLDRGTWHLMTGKPYLARLAFGFRAPRNPVLAGGADHAWAGVGFDDVGKFVLLQATGVLQGLAFGVLLLNSSAAIVAYFVLPTALSIAGMLWEGLKEVQPWIDLWTSQTPLFLGGNISSELWTQIATSTLIWVVLPLGVGLVRVLRAEVK